METLLLRKDEKPLFIKGIIKTQKISNKYFTNIRREIIFYEDLLSELICHFGC